MVITTDKETKHIEDRNVDTQGYSEYEIIAKIKTEYTNLMWGNNKTVTAKKGTLGPAGLKRGRKQARAYTNLPL